MLRSIIIFFSILTLLSSCRNQSSYTVKGNLSNCDAPYVVLSKIGKNGLEPFDTSNVDGNGNFEFNRPVETTDFFSLNVNQDNFIRLILKPEDRVTLNGDAKNLIGHYKLTGSTESELLREYNLGLYAFNAFRDSLYKEYEKATTLPNGQEIIITLQLLFDQKSEELTDKIISIVEKNPGTYTSMRIVGSFPQGMQLSHSHLYLKVDSALTVNYPNSVYANEFHAVVLQIQQELARIEENEKKLPIGSPAPEINLPQPNGKTLALSALKGKYVLIDFWASWCRPCRAENPNVVKLFHQYKDKGFDIYSVSLDKTKEDWIRAIQEDGLEWNHVSDLKFWNSSVVSTYGIDGIPFTVLLDKEGNIIDKNLRGNRLAEKLKVLFSAS